MTQSSNEVAETPRGANKLRVVPPSGSLAEFDPTKTKEVVSVLNAAVQHAKDMQDWKAGEKAAGWMVKEQRRFVAWWEVNVTPNRERKSVSADRGKQITMKQAEAETSISNQQVSRWRKEIGRPGYERRIFNPSHKKAMADGAQRRSDLQTGEMEWYTPPDYIDAVREVLGGKIDLDPASSPMAQGVVQAGKFYTIDDDGLAQDWSGTVWLNPPFKSSLVKQFAEKLIAEHDSGDVPAAVMVTNSYTETSWWHSLARASAAVCFTRGRIKFDSPHGEKAAPTNGQCFYYFGVERERFERRFSGFGLVMVVWP
jgi:hypothetical protein